MEVHTWGNPPSSHHRPDKVLLLLLIRAELETFPLPCLIGPIASCLSHSPFHMADIPGRPYGKGPIPTSPLLPPLLQLSLLHFGSALTQRVKCAAVRGRYGPLLRPGENMAGPRSPRQFQMDSHPFQSLALCFFFSPNTQQPLWVWGFRKKSP